MYFILLLNLIKIFKYVYSKQNVIFFSPKLCFTQPTFGQHCLKKSSERHSCLSIYYSPLPNNEIWEYTNWPSPSICWSVHLSMLAHLSTMAGWIYTYMIPWSGTMNCKIEFGFVPNWRNYCHIFKSVKSLLWYSREACEHIVFNVIETMVGWKP